MVVAVKVHHLDAEQVAKCVTNLTASGVLFDALEAYIIGVQVGNTNLSIPLARYSSPQQACLK